MAAATTPEKVVAPGPEWAPRDYLYDLNKTAIYVATRGLPFMLPWHAAFLVRFTDAWLGDEPDSACDAATALFEHWPARSQRRIAKWLRSPRTGSDLRLFLLLLPFMLPLLLVVPGQTAWSALRSSWDVFRRGIRLVPPLITAVVVVFVTSDAWRILGSGSTLRFWVLVGVFLVAGLLFLVQWTCWDDLDADAAEAAELLDGIRRRNALLFRKFTERGATATPLQRPAWPGQIWVYAGYWILCAFALLVTAALVAGTLILVGVILISKSETSTLAGGVHVYWPHLLPGGLVITRQLLQLSATLGAFAAFFLVAAQKTGDRKEFMGSMLLRYRRVLLVYSVYRRARAQAVAWTRVPVRES
jgi:hypothetical protein